MPLARAVGVLLHPFTPQGGPLGLPPRLGRPGSQVRRAGSLAAALLWVSAGGRCSLVRVASPCEPFPYRPHLPAGSPALLRRRRSAGRGYQLTAVGFARGGAEVVGSYSGHCIYAFDAVEHARDVESLLHVPEVVLR